MPSFRYHLSLFLSPLFKRGYYLYRRLSATVYFVDDDDDDGKPKKKSTRGKTSRKTKGVREEVSLSRRIRARINIGQRVEVFVGAERIPYFFPL